MNAQAGDSTAAQEAGRDVATGQVAPDNEVLRALSAAMASLFGDAPDSWLLDAEDVIEHLQGDGYRIVPADTICLEPVTDEVLMPGFDPDEYPLDPVESEAGR